MKITRFESLYSKEAMGVIDTAEWVKAIRDGEFKTVVEQIRECLAHGKKDAASALKRKLHAVVVAGDCRRGRFYGKTTDRTGWAMFDIDNMDPDMIELIRELFISCPWVVMVHVTSSGCGLRIVANIGLVHIDVYRYAYEIVGARIEEMAGMKIDMQCKDFARASLGSYDPKIYYNPSATVFSYEDDANPMNYVPATGQDNSEDFRIPSENPFPESKSGTASGTARLLSASSSDVTDVESVIDRFFSINSFVEGSRHNSLLRLGAYMRWRGVESWQLGDAVMRVCSRVVQPGLTEKEVRQAVEWGFAHGSEGGKWPASGCSKVHFNNMNLDDRKVVSNASDNQETKEDEEDEEEFVRKNCEPFPDSIFECLPQDLKNLLVIAKDKRERDVLLLSCITVLSSLFPGLRTIYGNQKYSAHLYSCMVAGAGSGKGMAVHANLLGRKVHEELERIYLMEKKAYEEKLMEWEMEVRAAFKEKRKPDMDLKPVEPLRRMLMLQTNTSKSQLMHDMAAAELYGPYLFSTEIDALAEALKTDYGRHTAELRMFFHHESVGQRFKTDKEPVEIKCPKLALMMTGTPEQLVRFISSTEDGMYSRFLFYMMNHSLKWKSQSPLDGNGGIDVEDLFCNLAEKLKVNFFETLGKEIMIHFTREQWDMHERAFQIELGLLAGENAPNTAAIIYRAGLIVMRVGMVFSGLRILEAGWKVTEYTCQDEDFMAAMYMVLNSIRHSAFISTMMNEVHGRRKISNFYRLMPVLRKMKDKFRFIDFINGAFSAGFKETAAKRSLKKYIESGLLSKTSDGYEKTDLLKKGFKGKKVNL